MLGGCACPGGCMDRGACVAGRHAWLGGAWQGACMAGGHAWWGACVAGGCGGHVWQGGMHDMHTPPRQIYYAYGGYGQ